MIIVWVGIKLLLEYLVSAGIVHVEIPKWASLGLIVVIFAVAVVYARIAGAHTGDAALIEQTEALLDDRTDA